MAGTITPEQYGSMLEDVVCTLTMAVSFSQFSAESYNFAVATVAKYDFVDIQSPTQISPLLKKLVRISALVSGSNYTDDEKLSISNATDNGVNWMLSTKKDAINNL